jgi:integrase
MALYKRPDSPIWWYSITIKNRRFREPSGAEDRALAGVAYRRRRDELRREQGGGKPELTLNDALARYWTEHASRLPSEAEIARMGKTLIAELGKTTWLSRITSAEISHMIARRRAVLSDGSVNRELGLLRTVMRRALLTWRVNTEIVGWKHLLLAEPEPRSRFLSRDEETRLFAALRPDFHPLVRFALKAGVRLGNVRRLRWDQIFWGEGLIRFQVKSKRPGGATHTVALTRTIRAILSAECGRHPEFVFTFVPHRARSAERAAVERTKGARAPFTRDGWRKPWQAALAAARIADFRFHDARHTAGTRFYLESGDIRATQKFLGHRDIKTTLRYENAGVAGLRETMERIDAAERQAARRKRK